MNYRSIPISLIVILFSILSAGCRNEKAGVASQPLFDHHDSSVYAIIVPDMTCHNCVAKIKRALSKMKEVQAVDCDTVSHEVFIKLKKREMIVEDDAVALIHLAGFRVDSHPQAQ